MAAKVELPFRHLADSCLLLIHHQLQFAHDLAQVVQQRNATRAQVKWMFTTEKACAKMGPIPRITSARHR